MLAQSHFIPLSLKRIFKDFELNYSSFELRFPEFTGRHTSSIGSLSGGERRLIEVYIIAKSISQFAILDEPFTHLNPVQIEKVQELLLQEKENKGLLITDHMFRHVTDICDDVYVLTNGKTHRVKSISEIETLGYANL
ncbi:MAG: hypothetical protein WDO16_07155 [Bacteroidota bacterium]